MTKSKSEFGRFALIAAVLRERYAVSPAEASPVTIIWAADKLNRLHNGPTRYELAAIAPIAHRDTPGKQVLIAYCMRQGRHTILDAVRKHGHALVTMMGLDDSAILTWDKSHGAKVGAWSVRFTGRTQRQAIQEGELPWIGDIS